MKFFKIKGLDVAKLRETMEQCRPQYEAMMTISGEVAKQVAQGKSHIHINASIKDVFTMLSAKGASFSADFTCVNFIDEHYGGLDRLLYETVGNMSSQEIRQYTVPPHSRDSLWWFIQMQRKNGWTVAQENDDGSATGPQNESYSCLNKYVFAVYSENGIPVAETPYFLKNAQQVEWLWKLFEYNVEE